MVAAKAILTARGGMTRHAAVVARGMGKPCVAGASELDVREGQSELHVDGRVLKAGEWITLDGATGRVFAGQAKLSPPALNQYFDRVLTWADKLRHLRVRTNADTPADAHKARDFGAEGIGLCRTEHMFFEGERIATMREMIVAQDEAGRKLALTKLLPMQRGDFEAIFRAMEGFPVTIRLLDPPLHEFLPHEPEEIAKLAKALGKTADEMIPLTATVKEFRQQAFVVRQVAEEVFRERQLTVPYLLGTMIELPRAALTADEIAREAQFFSFGTNDLTQTTWGLSRDDAGRFLPQYLERNIIENDPFQILDQKGVGKLIEMACKLGRTSRPDLKLGICGEHGGEPSSVAFCDALGMNYVSCSPFRVPIARLAAAQAALAERGTMDRTRASL